MKENDWIVAGLLNPDYSTNDFALAGLNVDNTLLLPEDVYKDSKFIQDKFTKDGLFQDKEFHDYYQQSASKFGELLSLDVVYGPFDPRATEESAIREPDYSVEMVANPTKLIDVFGTTFDNGMSIRELAQLSKIWDNAKLEWTEDTLEDRTLSNSPTKWFKTFLSEPLVYATYDKDGEHYDPFTGQTVKHKKGLYKLNEFGSPYTETLDNRSMIGKEVVSAFDTITEDGKGINKYDFFDSDGVDKSVAGTLMKSAAAIAPLFMGGIPAMVYSGLLISKEVLKALPMLYGFTTAFTDLPEENHTLNKLAAVGQSFTQGVSDAGKSSVLNMETLSSLMVDVALQWGLLKLIALAVSKLRGSNTLMKEAQLKAFLQYNVLKSMLELQALKGIITQATLNKYIGEADKWYDSIIGKASLDYYNKGIETIVANQRRLGADAALAYMALVSNTDVYQSMLEAGATKKEAATVALFSTAGMFSVDRFAHLGEVFFDDLTAESERQLRRTLLKEVKSWYKNVLAADTTPENMSKFRRMVKSSVEFGKNHAKKFVDDLKYHSTGFFGKAFGEGLEEVSEELVTDLSKTLYQVAGDLGFNTSVRDVGAWKDWGARYGMSFLGGALGGGLFYGVDVYLNGKFSIDLTLDELIYLVRNGKTNDALKMLEDWRDKGKLGSTSLSTLTTNDKDGKTVFLTAQDSKDSQNEFIYKRIRETILQLQNIIHDNDADLSDSALFEKMILSESRFRDLEKYLDLQGFSYTTGYQKDYQNALSQVVNAEANLKRAAETTTGISYTTEEEHQANLMTDTSERKMSDELRSARLLNLSKLLDSLKEAKDELNRFLSGEYSMEYTEKMLFALDPRLNDVFIAMTYDQWLKQNHGKTVKDLSPAELATYKEAYLKYKAGPRTEDLTQKFKIYKAIKEKMNPVLLNIQENEKNFAKVQEEFAKLSEDEAVWTLPHYKADDVLDILGETKESDSYVNRDNPQRAELVNLANKAYTELMRLGIMQIVEQAGGFIDPVTRRKIKLLVQSRNKDAAKKLLDDLSTVMADQNTLYDDAGNVVLSGSLSELDNEVLKLLSQINVDKLDTANGIWDLILKTVESYHRRDLDKRNTLIDEITDVLTNLLGLLQNEVSGPEITDLFEWYRSEGKEDSIEKFFDVGSDVFLDVNFDSYTQLNQGAFAAFLNLVENAYRGGNLESFNLPRINFDTSNPDFLLDVSKYNNFFHQYLDSIKQDPIFQLNTELNDKLKDINPVVKLVKLLGLHLNTNMDNLESILRKIDARFDEIPDLNDLILTSEERESFDEAAYILQLAQAYIYATSHAPNLIAPFGHNATLNEFADKHKDVYPDYKPLPVLSEDVAAMYINELDNYLKQMGILDESGNYNFGSYLWMSNRNEINKILQFIRTEKAWNLTCYDIFMKHPNAFRFTYDGRDYNLLEGAESIPQVTKDTPNALIHLNKLFTVFRNNVLKLLDLGWSYKLLWERSQILDRLVKLDQVMLQKTSSLDLNISDDNMSHYDKVMFLATILAMDSSKFYSYLKTRIEEENGIVPLTIQEWLIRVGISLVENPTVFNQTLEYIKELTHDPRPILYNTVFIGGNAGAGKSRVVARGIAKYIKDGLIWLSSPKESQILTLFESTSTGLKMLNRENPPGGSYPILMEQIGVDKDAWQEALSKLGSNPDGTDLFSTSVANGAGLLRLDFSKFGIKKMDNAPAAIIIDEATHLSNLELQLLSEYCRLNSTKLFLLGDSKQKGFEGFGMNINRENCLMVRTPNLGLSLRDENIQHQYNLNVLENLITLLINLDYTFESANTYKQQVVNLYNQLRNIHFRAYNQDELNGDLIVDNLPDVSKLTGTVAYVGSSSSSTLSSLLAAGLDVTVLSPKDILGLEFDYIVIDKNFDFPPADGMGIELLNFLLDVYTLISRGRKGSIIVDPGSALRNVIGENKMEYYKAQAPKIIQYADEFRKRKLEEINKLLESQPVTTSATAPSAGEPNMVLDKDFDVDSLDFTNNLYAIRQINITGTKPSLDFSGKEVAVVDKPTLLGAILQLKRENKFNAIIVFEFPKSKFPNTGAISNLSKIPAENLHTIIQIIPDEDIEVIKTDLDEAEADILQAEDFDEILDLLPDSPDETYDRPILAYGAATFTGMDVNVVDGKEVWVNTPSTVKRDMQIFTSKAMISDDKELLVLSRKIRQLKNSILYRRGYSALPDYMRSMIKEADYNNIKWYLKVGPRDNHLIRNTGFRDDGMEIGPKNLVYSCVGRLNLADGSQAEITLGLLANPQTWIDFVKKEITNASGDSAKLEKLKKYDPADMTSPPQRYKTYIDHLAQLYERGTTEIELSTPPICPGFTDLHRMPGYVRVSRKSKALLKAANDRLAELLDKRNKHAAASSIHDPLLDTFDRLIRETLAKIAEYQLMLDYSMRSLNPYTTISPMYIYTPSSKAALDINSSVIGRCNVVFVTNEEGADPEKLVYEYIKQKDMNRNRRNYMNLPAVPSVRMVVLRNLGVSFQDLSNPYLAPAMTSTTDKGRKQIYPFKTHYMGVRMYVGLWNFRANLIHFNEAVTNFRKTLSEYANANLDTYLKVKDISWRKKNGKITPAEEQYLTEHQGLPDFDHVSKQIDDFNDSLANRVKQFRLGSSLANGAYVRLLTGDVSSLYTRKDGVSGIYLDTATAGKYYDIVQEIFNSVLDKIMKSDLNPSKLLSAEKGVRNSFSRHIKSLITTNGKIEIDDIYKDEANNDVPDRIAVNFQSSFNGTIADSFSHIPAVLSKLFKFTSIRLTTLDEYWDSSKYKIHLKGKVGETDIDEEIPYLNIWTHLNMLRPASEHLYTGDELAKAEFDTTLSNFFSFALHGTLEDISDPGVLRASDALFPHGLYADPLSTTETITDLEGNKLFTKAILELIFFGANVRIGDPTFFIELKALDRAIKNAEKPKTKKAGDVKEKMIRKYPQFLDDIARLSEDNIEDTVNKLVLNRINKNKKDMFYSNNIIFLGDALLTEENDEWVDLDASGLIDIIAFVSRHYNELLKRPISHIQKIQGNDDGTLTVVTDDSTFTISLDGKITMNGIDKEYDDFIKALDAKIEEELLKIGDADTELEIRDKIKSIKEENKDYDSVQAALYEYLDSFMDNFDFMDALTEFINNYSPTCE